jgi:hypothetical protein
MIGSSDASARPWAGYPSDSGDRGTTTQSGWRLRVAAARGALRRRTPTVTGAGEGRSGWTSSDIISGGRGSALSWRIRAAVCRSSVVDCRRAAAVLLLSDFRPGRWSAARVEDRRRKEPLPRPGAAGYAARAAGSESAR